MKEKHQEEVAQLVRDHADSLKAVKRDMEEKLEAVLSERQVRWLLFCLWLEKMNFEYLRDVQLWMAEPCF